MTGHVPHQNVSSKAALPFSHSRRRPPHAPAFGSSPKRRTAAASSTPSRRISELARITPETIFLDRRIGTSQFDTARDGTRPPFRPQGVIGAIREVIRRSRVPDDEITGIIGPPDFLTGCEVTGDLAALASGEPAELTLRARITIDEANRKLLIRNIPPNRDIDRVLEVAWAYEQVSNQAGLYAMAKESPLPSGATGLPLDDVEPFFSHDSDLFVCTAAPGVSLEWLRDQVARIAGVVTTVKVALPGPLPDLVRQWVAAHDSEDLPASLAALEEALP